jgi:hypothetical protein
VRFTLLLASSALAATIAIAGCSAGGGSQAIPGGSQSSMAQRGHLQIVSAGIQKNTSCPSTYLECATVSKKAPFTQGWCISSTGSCNTPCCGTNWTWALPITVVKTGKPYKKLISSWSPNPGNPTTLTISEKGKVKKSHGKVKYEGALSACSPTYGCVYGSKPIGIITS